MRPSITALGLCIAIMPLAVSPSSVSHADDSVLLTSSQERWKAWEEKMDRMNVRFSPGMRTDTSPSLLTVPRDYGDIRDFDVAETAPEVDFGIIQGLEPWYIPIQYKDNYKRGGLWEGYGDVTKAPDGSYVFSIGDHRSYDGNAYVIRYDPRTKAHNITLDLRDFMGWTPDDYADSKIHGDMDIAPGGDTWFVTYFGPYPTEREWNTVYRGSWLFHHNIFTGETECLGIPIEGETWPYCNWDWERGVFMAVSDGSAVLAYDTDERRTLHGGMAPDGIHWYFRATMLDHDTGIWYATDSRIYPAEKADDRYRGDQHFVRYERRNNTFTRMEAIVPANPSTGAQGALRAHTGDKDADGLFWCFSSNGTFFTFDPAGDRTELKGLNWGRDGVYTTNMCMSPGRRYVYYVPGASHRAFDFGTPVVQYDTTTGRKKVIAFLRDHYLHTYGYAAAGVWGIELSADGGELFFYVTGGFATRDSGIEFHRPAMFAVHIPASERPE